MNDNTPNPEDLLAAAFQRLSSAKKVEVFGELVYLLYEDLSKFNDPVLTRETDILDGISSNIESRLEEIKAVYGVD